MPHEAVAFSCRLAVLGHILGIGFWFQRGLFPHMVPGIAPIPDTTPGSGSVTLADMSWGAQPPLQQKVESLHSFRALQETHWGRGWP